ncbi:MAG: GyrI-like domain-containing protein [Armatimonadetes bacterium]|nr:GyrI-like domain-containing protein [Armatimonadota bacterium]
MAGKVEILDVPETKCVYASFTCQRSEIPSNMRPAMDKAWKHAAACGGGKGAPFARYTACHGSECTVEVGFPVDSPMDGPDGVKAGSFGGFRAVSAEHVGDYGRLGDAYDAGQAHLEEEGLTQAGPIHEHYVGPGSPDGTTPPRTLVYFPVE